MREVEKYLPKGNGRCLDAGAGAGVYRHLVEVKGYEYFGIDIEPRGSDIQYGDVCDIPFEDNYFDLAICIDVIEDISDDLKAIRELYRVLKPKGILVLHTPNSTQTHILAEFPDNPNHVRKGYTDEELEDIFSKAGFPEIEIYPTFNILENLYWEIVNLLSKGCNINLQRLLNFDPATYRNLGWAVRGKKT